MAVRTLTIDGNVVSEIEMRDRLFQKLRNKMGLGDADTMTIVAAAVEEIFNTRGQQ